MRYFEEMDIINNTSSKGYPQTFFYNLAYARSFRRWSDRYVLSDGMRRNVPIRWYFGASVHYDRTSSVGDQGGVVMEKIESLEWEAEKEGLFFK